MLAKRIFQLAALAGVFFTSTSVLAGDSIAVNSGDPAISLKLDTRLDGVANFYGTDAAGTKQPTELGYQGTYVMFVIDGKINNNFSYSMRDRMNRDNEGQNKFVNSLDWLNLTYTPDQKFSITAGKQVVMIGTIEYGYNPIDLYFASNFWNHINPYQIGINFGYKFNERHQLYFQMTNSPFSLKTLDNTFAYNLMWYGDLTKWLHTEYSVNMVEYRHGDYINYIALGHKLDFGCVRADIDYMNRYSSRHKGFFKDFTLNSKVEVDLSKSFTVFAKGGYDQNKAQQATDAVVADYCEAAGLSRGFYGLGIEYCPLSTRNNKVRLHAYWNSSTDKPSVNTVGIGVRWQMNVLDLHLKK